ncbi:acyl-CoA dehydrogenase family protein [Ramlibacter sp. WS9]|uniref:acyl-CoA dehydrogenase family protein n=1 Tax=Ramlibacter sp. WS9 TaxID=1882741 RepID=UPI001142A8C9|nr:acyl-CoA dehydrogenase family protein [Ramlibacter sp. WS9]ROZ68735.1 acyl-CoA dehydrogenase [Ramlibacter sp. WS9]
MDFTFTSKAQDLHDRAARFIDREVRPLELEWFQWNNDPANLWKAWPKLDALKDKARGEGLWNLFMPHPIPGHAEGWTNLEYAPVAELTGACIPASEIFNCSAPDTGNMEVLSMFGSPAQQERWLVPLLEGRIRSAFLMTEPRVASSDATNVETSIVRDGDDYVINGLKWWISGIMDERCEVLIVLGKTDPTAPKHRQQSMILVPRNAPGVKIERTMLCFGRHNSPGGEAEVSLTNVRVPKENLILGEGRGFEVAQGRLGPGRIHHSMRMIGSAQRCLELMIERAESRVAFGRKLSEQSSIRQDIALSYYETQQVRLLTLQAADKMDREGNKAAMDLIAAITVAAPRMAQQVADRTIQVHGGMGVSDDTPAAIYWTNSRVIRIADGPDEVHLDQLARLLIKRYGDRRDVWVAQSPSAKHRVAA